MIYNYDSCARKREKTVDVMTFDQWSELYQQMNDRKDAKKKRQMERMARYYRRQRAMGASIMALGVCLLAIGSLFMFDVMAVGGLGLTLAGLYISFTKAMVFVDKFYLEYQEKVNNALK